MNIFYLDTDIELNAQYHVDRHVVKMIVEQAQLLSSVHWVTYSSAPYKLTHKNHPCAIWTRESLSNYLWLCKATKALCKEYSYRYERRHKTEDVVDWLSQNLPTILDIGITERPSCMEQEFKKDSTIESYREYYRIGKSHLHSWKKRDIPYWV